MTEMKTTTMREGERDKKRDERKGYVSVCVCGGGVSLGSLKFELNLGHVQPSIVDVSHVT